MIVEPASIWNKTDITKTDPGDLKDRDIESFNQIYKTTAETPVSTPPEMVSFGLMGEPLASDPPADESAGARDVSSYPYSEPGLNPNPNASPTDEDLQLRVHDRFGTLTDGQYWEHPGAEYLFGQASNDLQVPHPDVVKATHLMFSGETAGEYWDHIDASNKFHHTVNRVEEQPYDVYATPQTPPEDVHAFLDILGLTPGLGEFADGLNGLIYLGEGDYVNAGISGLAVVPVLGSFGTGARILDRSKDVMDGLDAILVGSRQVDGATINLLQLPDGSYVRVVKAEDGTTAVMTGRGGPAYLDEAFDTDSVPDDILEDLGGTRPSARQLETNEDILIDGAHGLQTRNNNQFYNVLEGTHGDPDTRYLWTIDERGINAALEQTPVPTPRGFVVHSNLSSEASFGGEVWFGPNNTVTINAGSGRFGFNPDAPNPFSQVQYDAAVRYWENLGYEVNAIPLGQR